MESLCIKIGQLSWELTVDLVLVENDGNVLDCMCYAALAALSLFKFPQNDHSEKKVQFYLKMD